MIDINVIVEADLDMIQRLADDPDGNYALKMVQRDATYLGGDTGVADFVYKVVELPKQESEVLDWYQIYASMFGFDDVEDWA